MAKIQKTTDAHQIAMMDYLANFRRHITPLFHENTVMTGAAVPYNKGTLLRFMMTQHQLTTDVIVPKVSTLKQALMVCELPVPEKGKPSQYDREFTGTNFLMHGPFILMIKDYSPEQWTDKQAQRDVRKMMAHGTQVKALEIF